MWSLVLLVACTGKDDTGTPPSFTGPTLTHTPAASVVEGTTLELSVVATDDDGVSSVSLFHRVEGASEWSQAPMTGAGADTWTATLEGDDLAAPGVEYYFKAVDAAETAATAYLPEGATDDPFVVPVTVVGLPLPFAEDFELAEGEADLSQLGWGSASLGFRGYPWQLSAARAYSGSTSVLHPHGYEDIATIQDWLVSPALDLSGVSTAQVTWYEYGNDASTATHRLYVSTGSRDPADGDYVPVVDPLAAPPEDTWGRSVVVDLSAYAGNPAVFLAWYWEGVDADDWYVDDVLVTELGPDLSWEWSVAPAPIGPGESGVVSVVVTNEGSVDAADVRFGLTFPDGGATPGAEATVGALAAGTSTTAEIAVTVDAGTPDNAYLSMHIDGTWAGDARSTDERFLVGEASLATVTWNTSSVGLLELVVGTGDPDAPTLETTVFSGTAPAGASTWSVDLTDDNALLPPGPGAARWWLRVTGDAVGVVDDFTLSHDGVSWAATDYPIASAEKPYLVWLPEPPDLAVAVTSPSQLDPGQSGLALSFSVTNNGAATTGPLLATLVSADADVTVTDPGPLVVDADGLGAGARVSLTGFTFDLSSAHVDSSAVGLDLVLSDDAESWTVPVSIAVPYPVLRITALEIDDDGGDGILDPDEAAELTFQLTNVGDEATVGAVSGALSIEASSTAVAEVSDNVESYGTIAANSTRDADPYTIQVTGGAPGDTLDLLLTLQDSSHTYASRVSVALSEPVWQAIYPVDDDLGDALAGWDFDLQSGSYRVVDGVLQMRLTSATPFDPNTLFIEAWGLSTGADWVYYRLVLQSGVVTMQGYDGAFIDLGDVTATFPDAQTVQFDVPIEILGLLLDEISFGWGTGWCGPPDYYCDHWPNGWGYPYKAFYTTDWFELSW